MVGFDEVEGEVSQILHCELGFGQRHSMAPDARRDLVAVLRGDRPRIGFGYDSQGVERFSTSSCR